MKTSPHELPTYSIDDSELRRRTLAIVRLCDGLAISQARVVLQEAQTIIDATHYVSIESPDFIFLEEKSHDPSAT